MGNQTYSDQEQNSKLLKGILIGGMIGGALALLDSTTRNKVKDTALGIKETSSKMITEVKENPGEVKDQMISQFKSASNTLKEAISDAQKLYQRVNEDIFSNMDVVKEVSNDALEVAKDAKHDLKDIGSKVKQAGSEVMDQPVSTGGTQEKSEFYGSQAGTAFPVNNEDLATDPQENKYSK
ncbi:hypothetical protein [Bacillus mesophilum]|uniref:hypothetical protein n=1 Tax=Bacillus mesophilum TaxID=1071718 RepID=UPI001EFFFCFB|nr:hypothetical protein [Bacillus mesophilum]